MLKIVIFSLGLLAFVYGDDNPYQKSKDKETDYQRHPSFGYHGFPSQHAGFGYPHPYILPGYPVASPYGYPPVFYPALPYPQPHVPTRYTGEHKFIGKYTGLKQFFYNCVRIKAA